MSTRILPLAVCGVAALAMTSGVHADSILWLGAGGGIYNDPANWLGDIVPTHSDTARFDIGGSYAVTLDLDHEALRLIVNRDAVDFLLGGRSYSLVGLKANEPSILIGEAPGQVASVTVTGGFLNANTVMLAQVFNNSGALALTDGSVGNFNGQLSIGHFGTGDLRLKNVSDLTTASAIVGFKIGSFGTAEVEGKGSEWHNLGSLVIGQSGNGELIVKDGGTLQGDSTANIGFAPGSTGFVDVFGPGSMWTNAGNIRVGFEGLGTLSVRDGGVIDPAISVIAFADDIVTGDGEIRGTLNSSGFVRPGAPLGALTVVGPYVQNPSGSLDIEIGGSASGDEFDRLVVTGNASLNGTLNITLKNSFVPTICDEYVVLTSPSISGSFSAVNFPDTPGLIWHANVGAGEVTLGVEPTPRDLLVASFGESEFHRYDGVSGGFIGNFIPPGANGISGPIDMQIGPDGAVYINDDFDRVLRYNRITGAFLGVFITQGSGGLVDGRGMAFGPDGNLYITSTGNNRVLRYNGTTGAPMGVFGQAISPSAPMSSPNRLDFGPDGNLYVTQLNNTVLKFSAAGAFLGTFVSAGSGGLNGPGSLAFGQDGHLYIGSTITDAILRYNGATGAFMGLFVPAGTGGLDGPTDLAFGQDGNLYSTSLLTQRVLRFNGATGAFMGTFAPTNTNGMSAPFAILFVDGPTQTPGDVNNNSAVDGADLGLLLLDWGPCPEGVGACPADFDCSGDVNGADLGILLLNWG